MAPPSMSSKGFREANRRISELKERLEHIIIYQSAEVMGDQSNERPKDYFCNPGGRLGIDKVCLPGFEPYKMCKLLCKQFKNPSDIRIIGYPNIDWLGVSRDPEEILARNRQHEYVKASRAHRMEARSILENACAEFLKPKMKKRRVAGPNGRGAEEEEEEEVKEFKVSYFFGWPVERHADWYHKFLAFLCPINMQFRQLRDMDVTESYQNFCINMGATPPLALCLLRCCLLFDGSDNSTTDLLLLRELDVPWNLAMIRQRFYSAECKTQDHIAMPGCQLGNYKEIMRYIRNKVELEEMSPFNAVQLLHKVVKYGLNVFTGMAESNAFLSNRVTEAMRIMGIISHEEAMGKLNMHRSLRTYQRHLVRMDDPRSPFRPVFYNPYDLARKTLLLGIMDMNTFKKLNSQNLALFLELMMSQIGHCVGSNNETHTPFGRAIELAPCCGTLSVGIQCGSQRLTVRYMANENSAGKDYSSKIITEIFEAFCDSLGVHPSSQGMTVLKRFTKVAFENNCMIQFDADGNVVTMPDQKANGMFYVITESRGGQEEEADTLIKFGYCRGDQQQEMSMTTCEGSNKERVTLTKVLMAHPNICMRCSNEDLKSAVQHEQVNTIAAVTALHEPGSYIYTPGGQEGGFADVPSSAYESRKLPLEGITASCGPTLLAGMNLMASTWLGLPNTICTVGFEINCLVLRVLDFLTFFSQKHLEPLFHSRCRGNNLLRLQKVYEARATSFTAWCRMVQYVIQYPDRDDAVARAVNSLQFDALALTDCPGMIWSLLRRCLHWGPILYSVCFIRECRMPIVPIDILVALLSMEEVPAVGTEARQWYDRVSSWLTDCVAHNRFCPAGNDEFNEYISSSGLPDGSVEVNGCLRVASTRNGWNDKMDRMAVNNLLAEVVHERHGPELKHSCGVSKDALAHSVSDMLHDFSVDIQRLLGVNMYDMERHFSFFGVGDLLNFKFMNRVGSHPFMIKAAWQRDPRELASIGGGVHVIQLLVLGAFAGDFALEKLHPKIINDLSLALLVQILKYAPKGMVPGNTVEIRAFNCFNCSLESVTLDKGHMKTEGFIRCHDVTFAETGILSRCGNIENFAIEDVLHMGAHCEVAMKIGCKVVELPPAEVTYFIRPMKVYCVYNRVTGCFGVLFYNESLLQVSLEYQTNRDDTMFTHVLFDTLSWQDEMKAMGYTMLPMVWRSGACISWENRVGCLVPPTGSNQHDGNFSVEDLGYVARFGQEELIRIPVLSALSNLLPIGQRLFLNLGTESAACVARRLPVAVVRGDLANTVLKVHLDSPNTLEPVKGKVYVACLVKQINVNNKNQMVGSFCETVVVDPWELQFLDQGMKVLDYILQ